MTTTDTAEAYDPHRVQAEAFARNEIGMRKMMERGRANTALTWAGEWKHIPAELKKKATPGLLADRATLCAELGVDAATAIECWDQIKAAGTATPENNVETSTKLRRIAAIDGVLARRTDIPTVSVEDIPQPAVLGPVEPLVDRWLATRAALAEIERAEHPDVVDGYGRVWHWKFGEVYSHDDTLAFPRHMIDGAGLPSAKLADNPNYSKLCPTCRQDWPATPEPKPESGKTYEFGEQITFTNRFGQTGQTARVISQQDDTLTVDYLGCQHTIPARALLPVPEPGTPVTATYDDGDEDRCTVTQIRPFGDSIRVGHQHATRSLDHTAIRNADGTWSMDCHPTSVVTFG